MMKTVKRVLALLFVLSMMAALTVSASAEYTYTVRIYAGNQGTFKDGSDVKVYNEQSTGERISFSRDEITLNNGEKYYVVGIREAGKDNNTATSSFPVTKDQDYVVAYGILGNAVAYTIQYLDANGNRLAADETYYGNVGDKPVVAYQYIDGYQPRYYNLTRTLTENAANNIFPFVYTRITQPTPTTPTTPGGTNTPATDNTGDNAGPGGATTDDNTGGNAGPGGATTDDNTGGNTGPGGTTTDDSAGPGGTTTTGGNAGPGGTTTTGGNAGSGDTTTPGGTTGGGTTTTPGGTTGGGTTTTPGGTTTNENPAGSGGNATAPVTPAEPDVPSEPEEIADLDVPLAGPNMIGNATETAEPSASPSAEPDTEPEKGLSNNVLTASLIGGTVVIAGLMWLLFGRKRKEEEKENDAE